MRALSCRQTIQGFNVTQHICYRKTKSSYDCTTTVFFVRMHFVILRQMGKKVKYKLITLPRIFTPHVCCVTLTQTHSQFGASWACPSVFVATAAQAVTTDGHYRRSLPTVVTDGHRDHCTSKSVASLPTATFTTAPGSQFLGYRRSPMTSVCIPVSQQIISLPTAPVITVPVRPLVSLYSAAQAITSG